MDPLGILGVIAAIGAALAVLWRFVVRPAYKIGRLGVMMLLDWHGRDGRPGVPEVPGLMQRIAELERVAARTEYHVGNGQEPALRVVVEQAASTARQNRERIAELERRVASPNDVQRIIDSALDRPDQANGEEGE